VLSNQADIDWNVPLRDRVLRLFAGISLERLGGAAG
jgi:hypothetical protein